MNDVESLRTIKAGLDRVAADNPNFVDAVKRGAKFAAQGMPPMPPMPPDPDAPKSV